MLAKKKLKRFNLLLLQEGEIYYEDFACNFFPSINSRMKFAGRLHLCSHSLFFVPDDSNYPILNFYFEKMTQNPGEFKQLIAATAFLPHKPENLFTFKCSEVVEMKKNNKPQPYNYRKYAEEVVIGLMYISTKDFLAKLTPILQIWAGYNKINRTQINDKLGQLYAQQKANFSFDITWLEDFREQKQYESFAFKVTPLVDMPGQIYITTERLYFQPFNAISSKPVKKYNLRDVYRIVKRRHLLRQIGIELIMKNKTAFFTFKDQKSRDYAFSILIKQPSLVNLQMNDQGNMTMKWQNGLISNFDYLLYLNFMADRTFNDLTQYPVFPWVISDYQSSTLDLNDEKTFRDLSKPIGALNPQRLKKIKDRFNEMPEPKFMYGTHYSTPGYVLYYLVRQAPEFMLRLQSGKFDAADRCFHSVRDTWNSVVNNDADVKEIIPEFYQSTGEFLLNTKHLSLGVRQHDGKQVNNVVLPPWAEDAKDYVFKCRQALESEYVSKNLHKWIDLIFGYKQKGPESVKADNVFFYLTYEGAVDIEKIKDPVERSALEVQIREFGQTPKQIFTNPHPARNVNATLGLTLSKLSVTSSNQIPYDPIVAINSSSDTQQFSSLKLQSSGSFRGSTSSLLSPATPLEGGDFFSSFESSGSLVSSPKPSSSIISPSSPVPSPIKPLSLLLENYSSPTPPSPKTQEPPKKLERKQSGITTTASATAVNHFIEVHNFTALKKNLTAKLHRDSISSAILSKDGNSVYTTSHDAQAKIYSLTKKQQVRRIADMGDMALSSCVVVTQKEMENSTWMVVGSWDNKIYVYSIEYAKVLETICGHDDAVSRICINDDKLLSGSWDATVKLWQCTPSGFSGAPLLTFSEHETEVECVNFDPTGKLAVSGSNDGDIVVYDMRQKKPIASFKEHFDTVSNVAFIDDKTLVSVSKDQTVKIFKTHGEAVSSFNSKEPLRCFVTDGSSILTGGDTGVMKLWDLEKGELIHKYNAHESAITCLHVAADGLSVISGSKDGDLNYWNVGK